MSASLNWREIEPWEPEETVGKLWHGWASGFDAVPAHEAARVALTEVAGRLAVLFRGLGGDHSVEFRPSADRVSRHRLSWRRRLGTEAEALPQVRSGADVVIRALPTAASADFAQLRAEVTRCLARRAAA